METSSVEFISLATHANLRRAEGSYKVSMGSIETDKTPKHTHCSLSHISDAQLAQVVCSDGGLRFDVSAHIKVMQTGRKVASWHATATFVC